MTVFKDLTTMKAYLAELGYTDLTEETVLDHIQDNPDDPVNGIEMYVTLVNCNKYLDEHNGYINIVWWEIDKSGVMSDYPEMWVGNDYIELQAYIDKTLAELTQSEWEEYLTYIEELVKQLSEKEPDDLYENGLHHYVEDYRDLKFVFNQESA